jgi:hypothetical protein
MEEHFLLVKRAKLECLDCDDDNDMASDNDNTSTIVVNQEGIVAKTDTMDVIINDEGAKASTKKVKVTINEEDGINITNNKDQN